MQEYFDIPLTEVPNRFRKVGSDFLSLPVNKSKLDFASAYIQNKKSFLPFSCKTIACHAGWGIALYGDEGSQYEDYNTGIRLLEVQLGFKLGTHIFTRWAQVYYNVWGSINGKCMFDCNGFRAFNKFESDNMTIHDIGKWYIDVAERMDNYLSTSRECL
jgi:hypothetical protein